MDCIESIQALAKYALIGIKVPNGGFTPGPSPDVSASLTRAGSLWSAPDT